MTLMWQEILEQADLLAACVRDRAQVRRLAEEIRGRRIRFAVIAARGTSDHAGIYGKYVIETLAGVPVSLSAPSVHTMYGAGIDYSDSLVIAVSQSGKALDALEVIKQAKKSGALTVSITNTPDSPLAAEADYHMHTMAGEEKSVAATKTFTGQLMRLAMLTAEWTGNESLMSQLAEMPEKLDVLYRQTDEIIREAVGYAEENRFFILARGMNYPIALEAALKIQETAYADAKGFAISDFYHGPMAMIGKDTPVILFAPEGPSFTNASEILKTVKGFGARVILVTNNTELKGDRTFMIPDTQNDIISAFYNTVFAQMFACRLSLAKGLDPDRPRSLKKVTITI